MTTASAYKLVRSSIVAFTEKYAPLYDPTRDPPLFPRIIGTGFVVHEDGIIATNAHVIRAIGRAPRPPSAPADEWPAYALLLKLMQEGMLKVPLDILGSEMTQSVDHGHVYYGPRAGPDLAFVHEKVRGLPAVSIDSTTILEEGMDIATAGFPMG